LELSPVLVHDLSEIDHWMHALPSILFLSQRSAHFGLPG